MMKKSIFFVSIAVLAAITALFPTNSAHAAPSTLDNSRSIVDRGCSTANIPPGGSYIVSYVWIETVNGSDTFTIDPESPNFDPNNVIVDAKMYGISKVCDGSSMGANQFTTQFKNMDRRVSNYRAPVTGATGVGGFSAVDEQNIKLDITGFNEATYYVLNYTFCGNIVWSSGATSSCDRDGNSSFIIKATGPWLVVPSTTINKTSIKPGETAEWTHSIKNNGPANIGGAIKLSWLWKGYKSTAEQNSSGGNWANNGLRAGSSSTKTSSYKATQSDVGNSICRSTQVSPRSSANNGTNTSASACATVPYDYSLTPEITNITNNATTEGDIGELPITGRITNKGPTKSHADIKWQMSEVVYSPKTSITKKGNELSASNPCAYFAQGSCKSIGSGTESGGYTYPSSKPYNGTGTIRGRAVGTNVCYVMSVQRASSSSTQWFHSQLYCMIVSKQPKVQVWGGDLLVGRNQPTGSNVSTSVTNVHTDPIQIDAPANAFGGLYKTGVQDDNKTPLPSNSPDTHWIIDRVYRPSGTANTCQKIVVGDKNSSTVKDIPRTSSPTSLYARVISQTTTDAGLYTSQHPNVTGSPVHISVKEKEAENGRPWHRTAINNSARWISQNEYGQNYSSSACMDPTFNDPFAIDNSNIYVFKLAGGFTIDENYAVNLNTVKLTVGGGFDNRVKFFVNGHDMGNWQSPGWDPTSTASAESNATTNPNIFKYGKNELEIHVQSTYSHTGILIDNFNISAKATATDDRTHGSWDEYGIVPSGTVKGMASASGYAGGIKATATSSTNLCQLSLITFTNVKTDGACSVSMIGNYKISSPSPAQTIADRFIPDAPVISNDPTGKVKLESLVSSKVYPATSNITLTSAGKIPKGKWVVIKAPNNTVTIASNIEYTTDPLSNASEIPQVVIIAKNIVIKDSVTNVDSWLVATGTGVTDGYLQTCDADGVAEPVGLTSGVCGSQLRVNGPVIANRLLMYRTAGADAGAGQGKPGEIFNLRPDAYLWANNIQSASGKVRTVQTVELPPRF